MNDKLSVLIIFAIGTVVVMIVGYLGNKLTDKAENAMRSKRYQRMQATGRHTGPTESLAARMEQAGYGAKKPEQKAQFCSSCGERLQENARFCPKCGAPQDSYRK